MLPLIRRLGTPEGRADPHPTYDKLRAMGPAVRMPWGAWMVTSYQSSREVLSANGWRIVDDAWRAEHQPAWVQGPGTTLLHRTALGSNPPDHGALRRSLGQFISPQSVSELAPQIAGIVHEHVDRFESELRSEGEADFGTLVGDRLPMAVICTVLGLPHEDIPLLCEIGHGMAYALDLSPTKKRLAQADRAAELWHAYWEQLVAAPRNRIGDDSPMGRWLDAETDPAVRAAAGSQINLMITAGHETTASMLSESLVQLLRRPDQAAWLLEHPEAVDGAVEELARVVSPAQLLTRYAAQDMELPGEVPVAAGQLVHTVVAAANRDPEVYPSPHDLDLSRPTRRNLAYGAGIHYCLGAPLARLEATTLFPELLRRFDLEAAGEVGYDDNLAFRGTRSVPVRRRARRAAPDRVEDRAAAASSASDATGAAGPVVVAREGSVLVVTLTRPDGDNRLDQATLSALDEVLASLPDDVAAVVLRAEGRHFCVGGDLEELGRLATEDPDGYRELVALSDRVLHAWRTCPAVTVAALHGAVAGLGLGLAVASDLRVAGQGVRFRAPETLVGIPVGPSEMLDRLIAEVGAGRTRAMLLLGDVVRAEQALVGGLAHAVVATEQVTAEAKRLARRIVRRDREAVRRTKMTMAQLPGESGSDSAEPADADWADVWDAPQARALRNRVSAGAR